VRRMPGYEWMGADGKVTLTDGRTGLPFDRPVLVGRQYMLKLNQLVLHKINARSGLGGPYAAVTQQPVGGKANHGGQRMGEMEVWAIQAYGCANLLNEMMTIKSDDIKGRHQSYADIVQGKDVTPGGRTAAFDGLCCELRGLGLEVTLGRVVDTEIDEILIDTKSCNTPQKQPLSLEEEYQVSSVSQFEENGVKMLEIPGGDYEPVVRPQPVPIITSLINGRNGSKPKYQMSEEPLIDDIDETVEEGAPVDTALLDAFITDATADLFEEPDDLGAPDAKPDAVKSPVSEIKPIAPKASIDIKSVEARFSMLHTPVEQEVMPQVESNGNGNGHVIEEEDARAAANAVKKNIWGDEEKVEEPQINMVDFPSISELTSLSHQLARLKQRELEMQDEADEPDQTVIPPAEIKVPLD